MCVKLITQMPVSRVGTAQTATQAKIRRMSSLCLTGIPGQPDRYLGQLRLQHVGEQATQTVGALDQVLQAGALLAVEPSEPLTRAVLTPSWRAGQAHHTTRLRDNQVSG